MSDLIERLRGLTFIDETGEAADEIERLECSLAISRGKHQNAIDEIERLRAALEHCAVARLCTSCEEALDLNKAGVKNSELRTQRRPTFWL